MKFTPMTAEELARQSLLPAGVYGFEVIAALDKISKAGNEMIELKLNVFGETSEAHVYDYLMEKVAYKLRHFTEATGLMAEYESGTLDSYRCNGKVGYCKIAIDNGNADFGPKNVVKDYLPAPTPKEKAPETPGVDVLRKLKPEEFNAKHGLDSAVTFDDDIAF